MKVAYNDVNVAFLSDGTMRITNNSGMCGGNWTMPGYLENEKIRIMKFPKQLREYGDSGSLCKISEIVFVDWGYDNLQKIEIPEGVKVTGPIEKYNVVYYK